MPNNPHHQLLLVIAFPDAIIPLLFRYSPLASNHHLFFQKWNYIKQMRELETSGSLDLVEAAALSHICRNALRRPHDTVHPR